MEDWQRGRAPPRFAGSASETIDSRTAPRATRLAEQEVQGTKVKGARVEACCSGGENEFGK